MSDFDEALKYLPEQYTDVNEDQVPAKYAQKGATNAEYNRAFGINHRGKIDGRIISLSRLSSPSSPLLLLMNLPV